jgi:osmotically-inducible protein OsmY
MKTDEQLKRDVEAELNWDPSINDSGIIVSTKDGIVTLAGHVPFYADKIFAEKATKCIAGVRGVANDIEVKPNMAHQRPDTDIAESAVSALRSSVAVPADSIKVIVRDGWITLEGNVVFQYQKTAAESAVRTLWGVKGVTNSVTITPAVSATDIRSKIHRAYPTARCARRQQGKDRSVGRHRDTQRQCPLMARKGRCGERGVGRARSQERA